jgi:hypothetical protein
MAENTYTVGTITEEMKLQLQTPGTIALVREVMPKDPMLYPLLFPIRSVDKFDFDYYVQQGGDDVPMALFMSLDSETPLNSIPGFEKRFGNLVKVGSKLPWEESDMVTYSQLPSATRAEFGLTYQDTAIRLGRSIRERQELMCINAITKGKVEINDGELKLANVDFQIPADQQTELLGLDKWSNPDADILEDIDAFKDTMNRKGRRIPTRAITTNKVWQAIKKNNTIKKALSPIGTADFYVTDALLRSWFASNELPEFSLYNRVSTVLLPDGTHKNFKPFPEDTIVFLPPETLGNTLEGPTVEASLSQIVATGQVSATGLWYDVILDANNDPPRFFQKVVATTFITFPQSQNILIAKVL